MKILFKPVAWLWAITLSFSLSAFSETNEQPNTSSIEPTKTSKTTLDVYKSPTCGCCTEWVDHIEAAGFTTLLHHPSDLSFIKQKHGISSSYQACHTAVSSHGYVFEGHIPAELMQRFLDNPPENAIGLAVPGMPMGSPGMEMGNRHDDYQVLVINKDGSSSVYAKISGHDMSQHEAMTHE